MIHSVAAADRKAHLNELRDRLHSEQQRLAELRRRAEQATNLADDLGEKIVRDRLDAARQADRVADLAETIADRLEAEAAADAGGPDTDRRLARAAREREIAAIERRNAARLREAGAGPLHLESLNPTGSDPD